MSGKDNSNRDDLLDLLNRVGASEVPGVETTVEDLGPASEATETKAEEWQAEPTPSVEDLLKADADDESETYALVTLKGLRHYRPDLVQALLKSTPTSRPSASKPSGSSKKGATPAGKTAVADFQSYIQISTGMLQSDPSTVSGRRLNNVRAKYLSALAESSIALPKDTDVAFAINGAKIEAVWHGEKPQLPTELDV